MNREVSITSDGISPTINLKALFDIWPAVIPVFIRHRMSCLGCFMSSFDTLGDAVVNYHLEWSFFLLELQAAISERQVPETTDPA
jgi:hybrid cluster-associated redox disulfide protein